MKKKIATKSKIVKSKAKKTSAVGKLTAIGAGLAGVAATAYFFLGPKGKKHIKQTKAWAIKMKGDVIEKLELAKEVSEPIYNKVIDAVAEEYQQKMNIGREEVLSLAQDLKKHWKTISKKAQ